MVALLFALVLSIRVIRADAGNPSMRAIAEAIKIGSAAFIRRELITLVPFVVVVFLALWILIDWLQFGHTFPKTALSYLIGTVCSASAGLLGMHVAIRANVRTSAAAMKGLNPALRIAFSSGAVMGSTVVGLGLLGVTILYLVF